MLNVKRIILSASLTLVFLGAGCSSVVKNSRSVEGQTDGLATSTLSTSTANIATSSRPAAVAKPVIAPKSSGTAGKADQPAAKSYLEISSDYKQSGYYFQFVACHASPGTLTLKKGVKFMLDNRDAMPIRLMLDGVKYSLGGYGYSIATAPNKTGIFYLTCNGGGSAQITVQP